jgi:hypothetical protein
LLDGLVDVIVDDAVGILIGLRQLGAGDFQTATNGLIRLGSPVAEPPLQLFLRARFDKQRDRVGIVFQHGAGSFDVNL